MVNLQHISTPANSNSSSSNNSDESSPSSSSPTSPLPPANLPILPSSPPPFIDPLLFSNPTAFPLHHDNYLYNNINFKYLYCYPLQIQHTLVVYHYPLTTLAPPLPSQSVFTDYGGDDTPESAVVVQPPSSTPLATTSKYGGRRRGRRYMKRFVRRGGNRNDRASVGDTQKVWRPKYGFSEHASGSHAPVARPLPPPSSSSQMGVDCTTVMVKNIPNSLSRRQLIVLLDRHCREQNQRAAADPCPFQYDFVYLPFDFGYDQNLGYAFVNFTTTEGAITLYNGWSGKGWERSPKVRQITRARVQGLENCKQYFQSSIFFCHSEEYLPVEFSPPRDGFGGDSCQMTTIGRRAQRGYGIAALPQPKPSRIKRHIPPRLSH